MIVRLKVRVESDNSPSSNCFNSMIVRLKEDTLLVVSAITARFNSMIVRLKVFLNLRYQQYVLTVSIL